RRLQTLYRDPGQAAVIHPAELPEALLDEAVKSVQSIRFDHDLAGRFLGSYLTEPKPGVVFDPPQETDLDLSAEWPASGHIALDRRTRMLYRGKSLFINGEPVDIPASALLRTLADQRHLSCATSIPRDHECELLQEWLEAGWLVYRTT